MPRGTQSAKLSRSGLVPDSAGAVTDVTPPSPPAIFFFTTYRKSCTIAHPLCLPLRGGIWSDEAFSLHTSPYELENGIPPNPHPIRFSSSFF